MLRVLALSVLVLSACAARPQVLRARELSDWESVYFVTRDTRISRPQGVEQGDCQQVKEALSSGRGWATLHAGDVVRVKFLDEHWKNEPTPGACSELVRARPDRTLFGDLFATGYVRLADLEHRTRVDTAVFQTGTAGKDYGFLSALPYGERVGSLTVRRLEDGKVLTLEDGAKALALDTKGRLIALDTGDVVEVDLHRPPTVRYVADYAAERAHFAHCDAWRARDFPQLPPPLEVAQAESTGRLFALRASDRDAQVLTEPDGAQLWVVKKSGSTLALRSRIELPRGPGHLLVRPTGRTRDLKLVMALELEVMADLSTPLCVHEASVTQCRLGR